MWVTHAFGITLVPSSPRCSLRRIRRSSLRGGSPTDSACAEADDPYKAARGRAPSRAQRAGGTAHAPRAGAGLRNQGGSSAAAFGVSSRAGAPVLAQSSASAGTGVPPLPESLAAATAPARPDLAPCPAKMAAVRRARSYCRCLVRFSDRELC
ncbi:uncharacterized protein LOC110595610 [Carlito syrichta]|uniref:Uncharacterized protein LOC110595610 n=1 Tax=Carlito syrichta TaxID=1868482 RepID=A0A3Q0E1G2_CARSF|nr:uncharacterized protein LOC110595610 [Carlito syrichta]